MKKIINNIIKSEDGSSLIELALILPVMLLMMVGAVDFGSAFARKLELVNAAKAGSQYALVVRPLQGDTSGISTTVIDNLGTSVNQSTAISVDLYCLCDGASHTCANTCGTSASPGYESAYVEVNVSETYQTPFFNYTWLVPEFKLSETSTIQLK